MTHDHESVELAFPDPPGDPEARVWDAILATDDPRQRAAALGAEYDLLARAARVLQGVLAIVVAVVVLGATAVTVWWGLAVPQVLLGALVALLSSLIQVLTIFLIVRVRPGSAIVAALATAVAPMVQMSIVAAVIVAMGADRSLVVGLVCGSISVVFAQWAGPTAAVNEFRRPTPRSTIVGFADAPPWTWAPEGRLAPLVTIGFLGMAAGIVETLALVVALPSFVLLLLLAAVISVSVNRAIASPVRVIGLQLLSIVIFGTIAVAGVALSSLAVIV